MKSQNSTSNIDENEYPNLNKPASKRVPGSLAKTTRKSEISIYGEDAKIDGVSHLRLQILFLIHNQPVHPFNDMVPHRVHMVFDTRLQCSHIPVF